MTAVWLLALLQGLSAPVRPAASEFAYRVPYGWRVVGAGMGDTDLASLPTDLATIVRQTRYALLAFAPEPDAAGCRSTMNVAETARPVHVTNRLLRQLDAVVGDRMRAAGIASQTLETRIVEKDGHNVGVLVRGSVAGRCAFTQMQFLIPGSRGSATITFSATTATFDAARPAFEAVALATEGMAEPLKMQRWIAGVAFDNPGDRDFALGSVLGVLVVGGGFVWLGYRVTRG